MFGWRRLRLDGILAPGLGMERRLGEGSCPGRNLRDAVNVGGMQCNAFVAGKQTMIKMRRGWELGGMGCDATGFSPENHSPPVSWIEWFCCRCFEDDL